MDILIVEDELPASRRLQQLILNCMPEANIISVQESVKGTVQWLSNHPPPDLMFLDIQLADNLSFEIFKQVKVDTPVIFTTAYDQYSIQAFKLNSIDYLLKPIEEEELQFALNKYRRFYDKQMSPNLEAINSLMQSLVQPNYKERFIIKAGQQLSYIAVRDIRYFYAEDGLSYAKMADNKRHAIDYTLDRLDPILDPGLFFRLNRKVISHIEAIKKIAPYFNGRLLVKLQPKPDFEIIVSRDRASDFKRWLDQ
jgi:DNA-binding LytR/AlgR family response regulator